MRALQSFCFNKNIHCNLGRRFGTSKMHLSTPLPSGLECCPFYDSGSVVDCCSQCVCSLFCCALICVLLDLQLSFRVGER